MTANSCLELQNDNSVVLSAGPISDAQMWRVTAASDGTYKIVCVLGNNVLGIMPPGGTIAGMGTLSQQTWTIEPRGPSFVIGNAADGSAIHIFEHDRILAFPRNNTTTQRWNLHPNPFSDVPNPNENSSSSSEVEPTAVTPPAPIHTHSRGTAGPPSGVREWRSCMLVDMPKTPDLRLDSIDFMVRYANTHMDASTQGTYQFDIIMTSETLSTGATATSTAMSIYSDVGSRLTPPLLNRDRAEYLYRYSGVKDEFNLPNMGYVAFSDILRPSRTIPTGSRVYCLFHMNDTPSATSSRQLSMLATATWVPN